MATGFSVFVNIGGNVAPSLGAAIRAVDSQIAGLASRLSRVHGDTLRTFERVGRGVSRTGERLQSAGATVSASVSAPLGLLAKAGGETAYQFEKAGNALRAVTEMTAAQRAEVEKLARAQRYFGPVDSMKASVELAKTGFNQEQILGTLPGTLKLGLAGDIDAAKATDIATNVLTSMRLPMENAAQAARSMARVGDLFSYVANKTNTDVEKLGETFKYAANIGAATGHDLETLAGMAGVMANVGIRGPEAGTALRSAFVRMVRPTKPMLGALARLKVNLPDYVTQSRTVDPDGILKTLQVRGIDASGARDQIGKVLADPASKYDVAGTVSKITNAIVAASGERGGAMDRDTLADGINEALIGAADRVDMVGFLKALKAKGATAGDIASIFDQRQGSRLLSLLTGDLPDVIGDIKAKSGGYIDRAVSLRLEGVVGAVKRLDSAYGNLWVSLGKSGVLDAAANAFEGVADSLESIGRANPALLRVGTYAGLAAVALGPLMLAGGALLRVLGPLARGLGLLGAAATTGLAARLVSTAHGITALSIAATAGLVARVRGLAAGMVALGAVGGRGALLAATGAALAGFGKAVLLFPVRALRAIGLAMWGLAANPVGIAITAIVAGLAALGTWVYNNWDGVRSFLAALGDAFSKALGPTAKGALDGIVSSLGTVKQWLSDALGPIDKMNERFAGWGRAAGEGAAAIVNALTALPGQITALGSQIAASMTSAAQAGYNAVTAIDWAGLGAAIIEGIASGVAKAAGRLASAVSGAASAAWNGAKGLIGLGGAPKPAAPATPRAPEYRARGGSVSRGSPYIVGEKGPELFIPGASGSVATNDVYRKVAGNGSLDSITRGIKPVSYPSAEKLTAATAGARAALPQRSAAARHGDINITNQWTINGAEDPRRVQATIDARFRQLVAQLESEQRTYLSD